MNIKMLDDGSIQLGDFNALQAFKIARKLEKDGVTFYTKALSLIAKKEIQDVIKYLLESEKEHLAFFESRISALQQEGEDGFEDDDVADYMDASVFPTVNVSDDSSEIYSQLSRTLTFGYKCEEKSIAFYTALLKNTSDEEAKKALQEIIKEEEYHLESLKQFG